MSREKLATRIRCPACASSGLKNIYTVRFTQEPIKSFLQSFYEPQGKVEFEYLADSSFALDECLSCGLIFQKNIPDAELSKRLYTQWIDPENDIKTMENNTAEIYAALAREIMLLLGCFSRPPAGIKFLDFGMGWGRAAIMARAFGCEAYGVELSERKAGYARGFGIKTISEGEIRGNRFDIINVGEVLEHLPEPLETLKTLKSALDPGGVMRITVPDGSDIKRRLKTGDWRAPKGSRNSLNAVSPLEHINCFTHASLLKMAGLAGLRRKKMPLGVQYRYMTGWRPFKQVLKNLLGPVYNNFVKKGTFLYFSVDIRRGVV